MRLSLFAVATTLFTCVTVGSVACDRSCDGDGDCDAALTCRVAGNDDCASTCVVRPLRGETCSLAAGGDTCDAFAVTCDEGFVCATRSGVGTCVPPDGRVINEVCNADDECAANLVCATSGDAGGEGGECAPATGRGSEVPCNDDAQCASGSCSGGACD